MSKASQYNNRQRGQSQQQQPSEYQIVSQSVGNQVFNELPVQQSQSEDMDILDKIDSLLRENQTHNLQVDKQQQRGKKGNKRQMLLNFKISQLQKIIQNLNNANKKLNLKLQQQYTTQRQSSRNNNDSISNGLENQSKDHLNNDNNILNSSSVSTHELTQMQGEFQEIEGLILEYKEQLEVSERKWVAIVEEKDQEIESLKSQFITITEDKQLVEGQMQEQFQRYNQQLQKYAQQVEMLKNRNQQLLIEVQSLQNQLQHRTESQPQPPRYPSPSSQRYPNYYQSPKKFQPIEDYRFNQKIQRQMQSMIKKLLKELSHQRKVNTRMNSQIKRLSNQMIELEKVIKSKNDNIYQLEMKIIHIQKNYSRALTHPNNTINPNKYKELNLTPNQNKNQSHLYQNNKESHLYQNNKESNLYQNKTNNESNPYQSKNQSPQYQNKQLIRYQRLNKQEQEVQINHSNNQQYTQYTEESEPNNYDDYVLSSIPFKANRNTQKSKLSNVMTSKQQVVNASSEQSRNISSNFIKQKKLPQLTPRQTIPTQQSQTKPNAAKQFLTFTLMQLQQGRLKITMKQKIIIISRLIDLYCKKIKTKNYYNLIAEEIQVYNFSQKHPNLIRIKALETHSTANKNDLSATVQDDTEESLMYNLAFIVENLVKEVQTVDRQDLQVDLNLSEIIEEILTKSLQEKVSYFQELSKSLQNSVSTLN